MNKKKYYIIYKDNREELEEIDHLWIPEEIYDPIMIDFAYHMDNMERGDIIITIKGRTISSISIIKDRYYKYIKEESILNIKRTAGYRIDLKFLRLNRELNISKRMEKLFKDNNLINNLSLKNKKIYEIDEKIGEYILKYILDNNIYLLDKININ